MDISAVQREIESVLRRAGLSRAAASCLARGNPSLATNIMNGHAPRLDSLVRLAVPARWPTPATRIADAAMKRTPSL